MSRRAWAFVYAILIAGALASACTFLFLGFPLTQWPTFLILTALATAAQLLRVDAINHQSYYATFIFIFAGVLLLAPAWFVLLVIISYCAEWAKERWLKSGTLSAWYLQPFNIATIILAGVLAHQFWIWLDPDGSLYQSVGADPDGALYRSLWETITVLLGALFFLAVNHLVTGQAIVLARKKSWQELGVLDRENLTMDMVLLLMGYIFAVMWEQNPLLVLVSLAPLVLIYRALMIPQLKMEAQTDGKTGLWNARYFGRLYAAEFDRANRFQRPLSMLMTDLDLLRNVNNTYGHIAGDEVLRQIGMLITQNIREYDIAGRFGGEEFCIALPETGVNDARVIADRLRQSVAAHGFRVHTSAAPIHVTMSIGIATHPADAQTAMELIHSADIAVYQAKLQGRNCTIAFPEVPPSVQAEHATSDHRLTALPNSLYADDHVDYRTVKEKNST
ncbi:MAG: diguanylate cyclase [Anaerolineae bacterium]